jgi:hypothetical protein
MVSYDDRARWHGLGGGARLLLLLSVRDYSH